MVVPLKPGIYEIPAAQYHADPADGVSLSSHIIHTLLTHSPRHAWFEHPRLNPNHKPEEKTEFDLGACSHATLFEGEGNIQAIEADDWRTKAAKEARDQARAQGKIPVLAAKLTAIRAMADAARAALLACELGPIDLTTGKAEQTLIWQEGDVWCRARPDWMQWMRKGGNLMLDYKSTAGSAEPSAWIRNQMMPMGFDVQAAHYLRGNAAISGNRDARWLFLVQENYEPYECSFVGVSPATLEIAQRKWDFAVALWQSCINKNRWNGYPRRIAYAEPTSWQMDEDEERRLTFGERLELLNA